MELGLIHIRIPPLIYVACVCFQHESLTIYLSTEAESSYGNSRELSLCFALNYDWIRGDMKYSFVVSCGGSALL